ncbi:peptidoglycan-binding LysM domain-containing protein [Euphorbia peplus]|nr:peptidoglycan-binding LysM domain-containing protein [Euphorbia peplus]
MESHRFDDCNVVNYSQFCVDDPLSCNNGMYPRRDSDSLSAAIDHPVSKFDTLAGVAIKYGVEVADIKKMNGLVSDVQMFAHKFIQIPLPGRHPPSPAALSNASDSTPRNDDSADTTYESFKLHTPKQRMSPAMTSLQGYYGLDSISTPLSTSSSITSPRRHRKSRSLVDILLEEKTALPDSRGDDSEKLLRRRQKSEADFSKSYVSTPIWDDSSGPSSCAITGKNLALRSKASNRAETSPSPIGTCESHESHGYTCVRKSSSTSNLHDPESTTSSLWWNLKPDLHAISQATIARPIFDGLPKPITSRRNKAALD